MNYRLSDHAIKQIGDRNIPIVLLEKVIDSPEQVIEQADRSKVFQSRLIQPNNKNYLLRVFINDRVEPVVIISVYLTSKISKYWKKL
jgi:hypothetical protein